MVVFDREIVLAADGGRGNADLNVTNKAKTLKRGDWLYCIEKYTILMVAKDPTLDTKIKVYRMVGRKLDLKKDDRLIVLIPAK